MKIHNTDITQIHNTYIWYNTKSSYSSFCVIVMLFAYQQNYAPPGPDRIVIFHDIVLGPRNYWFINWFVYLVLKLFIYASRNQAEGCQNEKLLVFESNQININRFAM